VKRLSQRDEKKDEYEKKVGDMKWESAYVFSKFRGGGEGADAKMSRAFMREGRWTKKEDVLGGGCR